MSVNTRQKLIEVARQLFVNKGVAHTTMNDIASASARGRRTIYTYFRNKKEIYNAVLEDESDKMVEDLRAVVTGEGPVQERLRAFLRMRLERYVAPTASSKLLERFKLETRRVERINSRVRQKEGAMMSQLLTEGCQKGVFSAERCQLLNGFFPLTLTVIDSQAFSGSTAEERAKAISQFIEFILTDISL
ncbi:MAG: TetR family transcriptional regulator [Muribaculaceae bacterium]|nr:TetR family transcriptional regulator [Muribaculaceae bacterium]